MLTVAFFTAVLGVIMLNVVAPVGKAFSTYLILYWHSTIVQKVFKTYTCSLY
jgi:hypothetical protein